MPIKLNNTEVADKFTGMVSLGTVDKLYVSSKDAADYSLYGTLFAEETVKTVTVPSRANSFGPGEDLRAYFVNKIAQRLETCKNLDRLEEVRRSIEDSGYDYGVSKPLVNALEYVTTNSTRTIPLCVLGGKLSYEDLYKSNEDSEPFEPEWQRLVHLTTGFKRYYGTSIQSDAGFTPTSGLNPEVPPVSFRLRSPVGQSSYGDIVAIARSTGSGVTLMHRSDAEPLQWMLDLFPNTTVTGLWVDTYAIATNQDVIVVGVSNRYGVRFAVVKTWLLAGSSSGAAVWYSDVVAPGFTPLRLDMALISGSIRCIFYGTGLEEVSTCSLSNISTTPAVSDPIQDTSVVGLIDIGFPEFSSRRVYRGDSEMPDDTQLDPISVLCTVPFRTEVSGVTTCSDIAVVITATSAYAIDGIDGLFSGNVYELGAEGPSYSGTYFGGTGSADEPTFDGSGNLIRPDVTYGPTTEMSYGIASAPNRIYTIPGGMVVVNEEDVDETVSAIARIIRLSWPTTMAAASVCTSKTGDPANLQTPVRVAGASNTVVYLVDGLRLREFDSEHPESLPSHSFNIEAYDEVGFAALPSGAVAEVHDYGIYTYSSVSTAGLEEIELNKGGLETYTNAQYQTDIAPDPDAIHTRHPITSSTVLDSVLTHKAYSQTTLETYTGAYSSSHGLSLLSSSSDYLTVMEHGVTGVDQLTKIPFVGQIRDGIDYTINGKSLITLFLVDGRIVTLQRVANSISVIQTITPNISIVGSASVTTLKNQAELYVGSSDGVYRAYLSGYGLVPGEAGSFQRVVELEGLTSCVCYGDADELLTVVAWSSTGTAPDEVRKVHVYRRGLVGTIRLVKSTVVDNAPIGSKSYPLDPYSILIWGSSWIRSVQVSGSGQVQTRTTLTRPDGSALNVGPRAFCVSTSEESVIYKRTVGLDEVGVISGDLSASFPAVSMAGDYVVVVNDSEMVAYKWWGGLTSERYYSYGSDRYKVPYYAVDFEDSPSHYTRTVIERDQRYGEPVTVAYDPYSTARSRKFITNRRLSFVTGSDESVGSGLVSTNNSTKLLRNGVLWALGLDTSKITGFSDVPDAGADYLPGPLIDSPFMDPLSMSCGNACGPDTISELLQNIPENGVYIPAEYLVPGMSGGVFLENKEVPVYAQSVDGTTHLRVEFGEYSRPAAVTSVGYETPNYAGMETGVTTVGRNVYLFWDLIWEQSRRTGTYLDTLLDRRTASWITDPETFIESEIDVVGAPLETDLVSTINPAKFVLAHLMAKGSVLILIRCKDQSTVVSRTLLGFDPGSELDTVPPVLTLSIPGLPRYVDIDGVPDSNFDGTYAYAGVSGSLLWTMGSDPEYSLYLDDVWYLTDGTTTYELPDGSVDFLDQYRTQVVPAPESFVIFGEEPDPMQLPGTVEVSGAGSPIVDGTYTYSGTSLGKGVFTSESGGSIHWTAKPRWEIDSAGQDGMYHNLLDLSTPPVSEWVAYKGVDPVPTVTYIPGVSYQPEAEVFTITITPQAPATISVSTASTSVTVSGAVAPDEEFNGEYQHRYGYWTDGNGHSIRRLGDTWTLYNSGKTVVYTAAVTNLGDSEERKALVLELAAEDTRKLPWAHINKTLPTTANCVILYSVDSWSIPTTDL